MFPKRTLLITAIAALAVAGAPVVTAADTADEPAPPPTDEPGTTTVQPAIEQDAGDPALAPVEPDAVTSTTLQPAGPSTPETSAPPPDPVPDTTAPLSGQSTPDPPVGSTPAVAATAEMPDTTVPVAAPEPALEPSEPPAADQPVPTDAVTPSIAAPPPDAGPATPPAPDPTVPPVPVTVPPAVDPPPINASPSGEVAPPAALPVPSSTVAAADPEPPPAPVVTEPPIVDAAAAPTLPINLSDAVPAATANQADPKTPADPATAVPQYVPPTVALPDRNDDVDGAPALITAAPLAPPTTPTVDVVTPSTDGATTKATRAPDVRRDGGQSPPAPFPTGGRLLAATWVTGSTTAPGELPASDSVQLTFPVLGPVRYSDGWGNPRGAHGERHHEGTDLLGVNGQPLRAVFDGVVTRYQLEDRGISGAVITITRDDGMRANYFHLNTWDHLTGREGAPASWRIPTAVQLGSRVSAGQIIGFMGDSGNATGVPHLHFELRTPGGVPFNPYPALADAEARERCTALFGPWANVGAIADVPVLPVVEIAGAAGAVWQLTARGEVVATTSAAAIVGDSCDQSQLIP